MGFSQPKKTTRKQGVVPQIFWFTKLSFSAVICIYTGLIEYAAAVLMMPLIGDVFDVFGASWFGELNYVPVGLD